MFFEIITFYLEWRGKKTLQLVTEEQELSIPFKGVLAKHGQQPSNKGKPHWFIPSLLFLI